MDEGDKQLAKITISSNLGIGAMGAAVAFMVFGLSIIASSNSTEGLFDAVLGLILFIGAILFTFHLMDQVSKIELPKNPKTEQRQR
jgi:hypothetical protein